LEGGGGGHNQAPANRLNIATVADAIKARGLKRIALFGSRSTVQTKMFGRLGVDVAGARALDLPAGIRPAALKSDHGAQVDGNVICGHRVVASRID
jgi:hypothetical protein